MEMRYSYFTAGEPLTKAPQFSSPKIVKTTTKQTVVQNSEGLRHNKEEKIEDLTSGSKGAVTVTSTTNEVRFRYFCNA